MSSPPPSPPYFSLEENATAGDRHSYNPSILIIATIIVCAITAAAAIHLLLRVLSRSRSPPPVHHLYSSSSSSSSSSSVSYPSLTSDQDPKAIIDSLPLFSISSQTATKSSSSLDCAVCLSPFQPSDELRLLPSCRHAFHSQCIDTWLKSNLSCPLCRAPIRPILTPPPPPPPPPAVADPTRSERFRLEIGSVSRRTDDSSTAAAHDPHVRSYSLGSSFEYVVEEEIEAVLARVRRRTTVEKPDLQPAAPPPGETVAEIAGVSHRSWLKDYVDRLTSSASSSFSSLRFSQRVSHGGSISESWDLERNLHLHLEEEDGGFSAFYRWLIGA